jgi:cytochrome c-type biogenesis protein
MSARRKRAQRKKRFWGPERLIVAAVILSLVVAVVILSQQSREKLVTAKESRPQVAITATTPTPAPPAPAPAVAAAPPALNDLPPAVSVAPLKDAKGASFKLADFFGKVMVVNLWATWCGPCRSEIPELVKLHKEFHPRGVEMIGLSTENPDASSEKVRKFIQDFQVDYRIGWAPVEVGVPLMQGHDAIPQTFVISRDGRILKHFMGFSAANTSAQLKQALEDALN